MIRRLALRRPGTPPWGMDVHRSAMWFLLAAGLIVLPFFSSPGEYVNDTRDALWLDPGGYLSRAFTLWRSSPYLGHEHHDAIVFPMGVVVWLLRGIGLSAWAAERVWHGLLLLVAAGGTVLLVDHLRGTRSVLGPLTAGLVYALTPYAFGYGLPTTGAFLPYVLLPALLLVTSTGARGGGLAWAGLFALVVFAMGGGNGAPQLYALIAAGLLVLWIVATERNVPRTRILAFAVVAAGLTIGVNAYWLYLLTTGEVSNALAFSEQPDVINVSSSAAETVRGLGFWMFYGGDRFGPWTPSVRPYVTNPLLVLSGFALPAVAVLSAWRVAWRDRGFFVLLAVLGVFVVGGIYPADEPTPFGRLLLGAYRDVPGAAGLRTTYKFAPALLLSIAVLAGIGVAAAAERLRATRLAAAAVVGAVVVVVALNGHPLFLGRMYNDARSSASVPGYWNQATSWLEERDAGYRSFFAPATDRTVYRWGALREGIAGSSPYLSAIRPHRLPVGERYGSNLLLAIEEPYFQGLPVEGTAQLLRYLGARFVVLQNDIDTELSDTAAPGSVRRLADAGELEEVASFGTADVVDGLEAGEPAPPPVEILEVDRPATVVRAESGGPIVVSGDGFGLASAARAGLLPEGRPVLYSGTLGTEHLRRILDQGGGEFIVTDSNRRRVWSFASPRAQRSSTIAATAALGTRGASFSLFGDRPETQSVAEYPELAALESSRYGGVFRDDPAFRPSNAFDGDAETAWLAGALGDPRGEWVKAVFEEPRLLSGVTLSTPDQGFGRQLETVRLEFSDGTSHVAEVEPGRSVTATFRQRTTSFVRVQIVGFRESPTGATNGVGLAEIGIAGIEYGEAIRVPVDLLELAREVEGGLEALADSPLHYVFERARTGDPDVPDEERRLVRRFEVPGTRVFTLRGTTSLDVDADDDAIDELVHGPLDVRATSTSRLFSSPRFRASSAIDRDPETAWVARGVVGESLTIEFPPRELDRIEIDTQLEEGRTPILGVEVAFPDGTVEEGRLRSLLDGTITVEFEPRESGSVTVTVARLGPTGPELPVGISEIRIPGVRVPPTQEGDPIGCIDLGFRLDDEPFAVRPEGTVGQLLEGEALETGLCEPEGLMLGAGWHTLSMGPTLRADSLLLSSIPDAGGFGDAGATSDAPPDIAVDPRPGSGLDVFVRAGDAPYYLVIGQNFSTGWTASIDGEELGTPELVDGYSAGWHIHREGSYVVSVRYGPQGGYTAALVVSALTLIAIGAVILVARRRRGTW